MIDKKDTSKISSEEIRRASQEAYRQARNEQLRNRKQPRVKTTTTESNKSQLQEYFKTNSLKSKVNTKEEPNPELEQLTGIMSSVAASLGKSQKGISKELSEVDAALNKLLANSNGSLKRDKFFNELVKSLRTTIKLNTSLTSKGQLTQQQFSKYDENLRKVVDSVKILASGRNKTSKQEIDGVSIAEEIQKVLGPSLSSLAETLDGTNNDIVAEIKDLQKYNTKAFTKLQDFLDSRGYSEQMFIVQQKEVAKEILKIKKDNYNIKKELRISAMRLRDSKKRNSFVGRTSEGVKQGLSKIESASDLLAALGPAGLVAGLGLKGVIKTSKIAASGVNYVRKTGARREERKADLDYSQERYNKAMLDAFTMQQKEINSKLKLEKDLIELQKANGEKPANYEANEDPQIREMQKQSNLLAEIIEKLSSGEKTSFQSYEKIVAGLSKKDKTGSSDMEKLLTLAGGGLAGATSVLGTIFSAKKIKSLFSSKSDIDVDLPDTNKKSKSIVRVGKDVSKEVVKTGDVVKSKNMTSLLRLAPKVLTGVIPRLLPMLLGPAGIIISVVSMLAMVKDLFDNKDTYSDWFSGLFGDKEDPNKALPVPSPGTPDQPLPESSDSEQTKKDKKEKTPYVSNRYGRQRPELDKNKTINNTTNNNTTNNSPVSSNQDNRNNSRVINTNSNSSNMVASSYNPITNSLENEIVANPSRNIRRTKEVNSATLNPKVNERLSADYKNLNLTAQEETSLRSAKNVGGGSGVLDKYTSSMITKISKENGIDPNFMIKLALRESGGNNEAISHTGALGLYQYTNKTAESMGITNRLNPVQSIEATARLTLQNAKILKDKKLPITESNLYTLFNLGPEAGVQVIRAARGERVRLDTKATKFMSLNNASSVSDHQKSVQDFFNKEVVFNEDGSATIRGTKIKSGEISKNDLANTSSNVSNINTNAEVNNASKILNTESYTQQNRMVGPDFTVYASKDNGGVPLPATGPSSESFTYNTVEPYYKDTRWNGTARSRAQARQSVDTYQRNGFFGTESYQHKEESSEKEVKNNFSNSQSSGSVKVSLQDIPFFVDDLGLVILNRGYIG